MDFRLTEDLADFLKKRLELPVWGVLAACVGMGSFDAHADYVYRVNQRETLSGILQRLNISPIYGKKGFLSMTLKRNPGLARNRGNRIFPGDEVVIPTPDRTDVGAVTGGRSRTLATETSCPVSTEKVKLPAGEPAIVQAVVPADFHPFSKFGFRPRVGFYHLDSTDSANQSRAVLFSSQSPGIQVSGDWYWSEAVRSGFNLSHQWVEMTQPSVGTLKESKRAVGGFDFHAGYRLNPWLDAEAFVGYESRMFSRGESVGVATIDLLPMATYGIRLEPRLIKRDTLELLLGLEGKGIGSFTASSYSVKSSFEYLIGPVLRQKVGRSWIEIRGVYGSHSQQSTITQQTLKTVGLQLGYQFEVGR